VHSVTAIHTKYSRKVLLKWCLFAQGDDRQLNAKTLGTEHKWVGLEYLRINLDSNILYGILIKP
jgi:hypothetical protein